MDARPKLFSSFSLTSSAPTSAQKDNDSVQKMLQRMAGNVAGAKQAMSVKPPQVGVFQQAVVQPGLAFPGTEQKSLFDAEFEALAERARSVSSIQQIQDVSREILTKFQMLKPEQLAELIQRMDTVIGHFPGDFLTTLGALLAGKLKELSSTQMASLMASFLAWPPESRQRFSDASRDFISASSLDIPSRLMELAPNELNCCLAAFVALGGAEHRFFTAVGRSAHARHKIFGPSQLASLLTILAEMRVVHNELFNAAGQALSTRVKEMRPVDILRAMRAFARCNARCDVLCQAIGDDVVRRFAEKGTNTGLRVEDLCEISWCLCALQAAHHDLFQLLFKQLEDVPKVSTDALCQLYEIHLSLDLEHKDSYSKYRLPSDTVISLLEHYKDNRKEARRCADKLRADVVTALKGLVDGTVTSNHRTSIGLLVDVAALKKRNALDGFVHIDIDSAISLIRPVDQDELSPAALIPDGSVALRRRLLQKQGLKVVSVRDGEWKTLEESKEKRRLLRSLLAPLGDVLE